MHLFLYAVELSSLILELVELSQSCLGVAATSPEDYSIDMIPRNDARV